MPSVEAALDTHLYPSFASKTVFEWYRPPCPHYTIHCFAFSAKGDILAVGLTYSQTAESNNASQIGRTHKCEKRRKRESKQTIQPINYLPLDRLRYLYNTDSHVCSECTAVTMSLPTPPQVSTVATPNTKHSTLSQKTPPHSVIVLVSAVTRLPLHCFVPNVGASELLVSSLKLKNLLFYLNDFFLTVEFETFIKIFDMTLKVPVEIAHIALNYLQHYIKPLQPFVCSSAHYTFHLLDVRSTTRTSDIEKDFIASETVPNDASEAPNHSCKWNNEATKVYADFIFCFSASLPFRYLYDLDGQCIDKATSILPLSGILGEWNTQVEAVSFASSHFPKNEKRHSFPYPNGVLAHGFTFAVFSLSTHFDAYTLPQDYTQQSVPFKPLTPNQSNLETQIKLCSNFNEKQLQNEISVDNHSSAKDPSCHLKRNCSQAIAASDKKSPHSHDALALSHQKKSTNTSPFMNDAVLSFDKPPLIVPCTSFEVKETHSKTASSSSAPTNFGLNPCCLLASFYKESSISGSLVLSQRERSHLHHLLVAITLPGELLVITDLHQRILSFLPLFQRIDVLTSSPQSSGFRNITISPDGRFWVACTDTEALVGKFQFPNKQSFDAFWNTFPSPEDSAEEQKLLKTLLHPNTDRALKESILNQFERFTAKTQSLPLSFSYFYAIANFCLTDLPLRECWDFIQSSLPQFVQCIPNPPLKIKGKMDTVCFAYDRQLPYLYLSGYCKGEANKLMCFSCGSFDDYYKSLVSLHSLKDFGGFLKMHRWANSDVIGSLVGSKKCIIGMHRGSDSDKNIGWAVVKHFRILDQTDLLFASSAMDNSASTTHPYYSPMHEHELENLRFYFIRQWKDAAAMEWNQMKDCLQRQKHGNYDQLCMSNSFDPKKCFTLSLPIVDSRLSGPLREGMKHADSSITNSADWSITNSADWSITNSVDWSITNSADWSITNSADWSITNSADWSITNSADWSITNSADWSITNATGRSITATNADHSITNSAKCASWLSDGLDGSSNLIGTNYNKRKSECLVMDKSEQTEKKVFSPVMAADAKAESSPRATAGDKYEAKKALMSGVVPRGLEGIGFEYLFHKLGRYAERGLSKYKKSNRDAFTEPFEAQVGSKEVKDLGFRCPRERVLENKSVLPSFIGSYSPTNSGLMALFQNWTKRVKEKGTQKLAVESCFCISHLHMD